MRIRELLLEKHDYEGLIRPFLKEMEKNNYSKEDIDKALQIFKNEIKWAKHYLRKNNFIIWYLRLAKMFTYDYFADDVLYDFIINDLKKIQEKYDGLDLQYVYNSMREYINSIKKDLIHYLGLPIDKIFNYNVSRQSPINLMLIFKEIERDWKDKVKNRIEYIKNDKSTEIVLSFPDNWYWVKLDRYSCKAEAEAMGHCGNEGGNPDDRILSLRKLVSDSSEKYWMSYLTFIIDSWGYLGEMKGRGNTKPAAKYHPYIIKLLEQPFVKGIIGGGYLPQNNFRLNDLTDNEKKRVLLKNKNLRPIKELYKENGFTSDIYHKIKRLSPFYIIPTNNGKYATIRKFLDSGKLKTQLLGHRDNSPLGYVLSAAAMCDSSGSFTNLFDLDESLNILEKNLSNKLINRFKKILIDTSDNSNIKNYIKTTKDLFPFLRNYHDSDPKIDKIYNKFFSMFFLENVIVLSKTENNIHQLATDLLRKNLYVKIPYDESINGSPVLIGNDYPPEKIINCSDEIKIFFRMDIVIDYVSIFENEYPANSIDIDYLIGILTKRDISIYQPIKHYKNEIEVIQDNLYIDHEKLEKLFSDFLDEIENF